MAHIHELVDYAVTALVVHEGKVLFVNHPKYNLWLPIGGHVELNEDPEQALFREIKEEAGIDKENIDILADRPDSTGEDGRFLYTPNFLDQHWISEKHQHIAFVYIVRSKTDQITLDPDEHTEIKWLTKAELDESRYAIIPRIKHMAVEAINRESAL